MDNKVLFLIYELKGLISGLSDLAEYEEALQNFSMIERLENKTNEIVQIIEGNH